MTTNPTTATVEAGQIAWLDAHYPRCTRCSLRTYVHNLTGARVDEVTTSPSCPAYLEPADSRPAYPYFGSRHVVAGDR